MTYSQCFHSKFSRLRRLTSMSILLVHQPIQRVQWRPHFPIRTAQADYNGLYCYESAKEWVGVSLLGVTE